jgi:hypothetical protein
MEAYKIAFLMFNTNYNSMFTKSRIIMVFLKTRRIVKTPFELTLEIKNPTSIAISTIETIHTLLQSVLRPKELHRTVQRREKEAHRIDVCVVAKAPDIYRTDSQRQLGCLYPDGLSFSVSTNLVEAAAQLSLELGFVEVDRN